MARTARAPPRLNAALPELQQIERIVAAAGPGLRQHVACTVTLGDTALPVPVIVLGSAAPEVPAVACIGGVHGLERIGTAVVLAWLNQLAMRLHWDDTLHRQLESVRLVFMPVVNPGGLLRRTRANPNGVDLMRNAPVDCDTPAPWGLGGQRVSNALPWYRGPAGAPMEAESQALCDVIERELLGAPLAIAIDCHSGFGLADRLWFPLAHTARPMAQLAELHALVGLFEASHPQHPYVIEPQSRQYLTHGDLWDHLVARAAARASGVFLPLTLEMGSWRWIKKNPRQVFSRHGLFNPLVDHRHQRVLRRHLPWLDFVGRAAASHTRWLPAGDEARAHHDELARRRWYAAP